MQKALEDSLCQFQGCANAQEAVQPKTGLKLCEAHSKEFAALVRANNTKGIVKFWVRSGGLLRLEQDILADK